MLKTKLFGVPQISLNNQALSAMLTGRKLALLSYLLVTGQPCDRGILADLLWCDLSEQDARKHLRSLLYNLRQHLPNYLVVTKTTVAISLEQRHWTDAHVFISYMTSEFPPDDADILREVLALYQGEFLAGFDVQHAPYFNEWLAAQRAALHEQALQGLHWLGEQYLARQDYAAGLAVTRQALTLAPWCETSHRQQMLLLAAGGQPQDALVQYESYRHLLAEEYGADPLPDTTLLYQQIKNKAWAKPDAQQLATWQRALERPEIRVNWEAVPQQPQLVGRENELNALAHWLYTEPTPLIAVVGLPGQGKTALLAELVLRVVEAAEDQASATAAWQRTQVMPPGARFEQILWYSLAGAPSFSHLIEDWLQQLAPPATDTPGAYRNGQPATPERQLTALLDHLRKKRCLLILDQVEAILEPGAQGSGYQPADGPFGEFLRRLCAGKHTSSVILLSRVELPALSRIRQRHSAVRLLTLNGLATTAGAALLQQQGMTAQDEALHAVVEQVGGHPLALLEIADLCRTIAVPDPAFLLANGRAIFGQLQHKVQQQFQQLRPVEQDLLIRLTYRREPMAVETLWRHGMPARLRGLAVEALQTVQRQALVVRHRQADTVSLPQVVLLYLTEQLVGLLLAEMNQICRQLDLAEYKPTVAPWPHAHRQGGERVWEVAGGASVGALFPVNGATGLSHDVAFPIGFPVAPVTCPLPPRRVQLSAMSVKPLYLNRYPLVSPDATAASRREQQRCLVQPLVEHLHEQWGARETQRCLQDLLTLLETSDPVDGYLAENIRSLLCA